MLQPPPYPPPSQVVVRALTGMESSADRAFRCHNPAARDPPQRDTSAEERGNGGSPRSEGAGPEDEVESVESVSSTWDTGEGGVGREEGEAGMGGRGGGTVLVLRTERILRDRISNENTGSAGEEGLAPPIPSNPGALPLLSVGHLMGLQDGVAGVGRAVRQ